MKYKHSIYDVISVATIAADIILILNDMSHNNSGVIQLITYLLLLFIVGSTVVDIIIVSPP